MALINLGHCVNISTNYMLIKLQYYIIVLVKYAMKFTVFSLSIFSARHCHYKPMWMRKPTGYSLPWMTSNCWFCDVQLACFPARRGSEQFAQIVLYVTDHITVCVTTPALRSDATFNALNATTVKKRSFVASGGHWNLRMESVAWDGRNAPWHAIQHTPQAFS